MVDGKDSLPLSLSRSTVVCVPGILVPLFLIPLFSHKPILETSHIHLPSHSTTHGQAQRPQERSSAAEAAAG